MLPPSVRFLALPIRDLWYDAVSPVFLRALQTLAMACSLIALGSNLGDRAGQLQRALGELARLPQTRLIARSQWHETPPAGGPAGQGPFLNGAALLGTSLAPPALLAELHRVEALLGRVRAEQWAARSLDLDLLLYDRLARQTPELAIPHPRMAFRRFVLEPAAEAAPWMLHPESGWTVQRLLDQLNDGAELIGVAAVDHWDAERLAAELAKRLALPPIAAAEDVRRPAIVTFGVTHKNNPAPSPRPKLVLAPACAASMDPAKWRTILQLPPNGPVAWITSTTAEQALHEALAAVHSVWPSLAMSADGQ